MGQSLGLVRGLGPWAAAAIVVGGMIGQSVFLVASDMSREVGSLTKVLVAWMVGGANRNDCFGFRRSPRQFSGRT
jgi:hypothetical protein